MTYEVGLVPTIGLVLALDVEFVAGREVSNVVMGPRQQTLRVSDAVACHRSILVLSDACLLTTALNDGHSKLLSLLVHVIRAH